ncbi:MAG: hypothetical protein ABIO70_28610 [Pseudomonadota bacterium]
MPSLGSAEPTSPRSLLGQPAFGPVARGFLLGLLFGLLALLVGLSSALLVLGAGAAGALIGLAWSALQRLHLDYREAFASLLRKKDLE